MAIHARYRCLQCKNEFEATEGPTKLLAKFRCVKCDSTVSIPHDHVAAFDRACKNCGGAMMEDLSPMCPRCKSRDCAKTELIRVID